LSKTSQCKPGAIPDVMLPGIIKRRSAQPKPPPSIHDAQWAALDAGKGVAMPDLGPAGAAEYFQNKGWGHPYR
jgi:hypothetical protein